MARHGVARNGRARLGFAGHGVVGHGRVRRGRARRGMAVPCGAWPGRAGKGKARQGFKIMKITDRFPKPDTLVATCSKCAIKVEAYLGELSGVICKGEKPAGYPREWRWEGFGPCPECKSRLWFVGYAWKKEEKEPQPENYLG